MPNSWSSARVGVQSTYAAPGHDRRRLAQLLAKHRHDMASKAWPKDSAAVHTVELTREDGVAAAGLHIELVAAHAPVPHCR